MTDEQCRGRFTACRHSGLGRSIVLPPGTAHRLDLRNFNRNPSTNINSLPSLPTFKGGPSTLQHHFRMVHKRSPAAHTNRHAVNSLAHSPAITMGDVMALKLRKDRRAASCVIV
ncbi:hypothetical protein CDEST_04907 [Colletotrichum destructivum]|uniref:Uncharacterized protein n=1 Tax=Colletotrichum destructivum TaxID=34406 RepID=A0AAX4I956_9PEZI|nr:hypothetical protein CDEST_04907 [Colletotrichum destructivum]